jgi:hypothetical protein
MKGFEIAEQFAPIRDADSGVDGLGESGFDSDPEDPGSTEENGLEKDELGGGEAESEHHRGFKPKHREEQGGESKEDAEKISCDHCPDEITGFPLESNVTNGAGLIHFEKCLEDLSFFTGRAPIGEVTHDPAFWTF